MVYLNWLKTKFHKYLEKVFDFSNIWKYELILDLAIFASYMYFVIKFGQRCIFLCITHPKTDQHLLTYTHLVHLTIPTEKLSTFFYRGLLESLIPNPKREKWHYDIIVHTPLSTQSNFINNINVTMCYLTDGTEELSEL